MSLGLDLYRIVLVFLAILFPSFTQSAEPFGPSIFSGQSERLDMHRAPLYLNPQFDLQYLVARMERNRQPNHFCLVGYRWPDGQQQAAVYWREARTIRLWDGRREVPDRYSRYASSLFMSPSIDLDHDVVDREADMGMATYLRSDVEGTLADCEAHGIRYRLDPFEPPKDEAEDDEGWE